MPTCNRVVRPAVVLLVAVLLLTGCASMPYRYGKDIEGPDTLMLAAGEPRMERGRPNAALDGFGHYFFSLPSKLILWNWKVDNHNVSPETEAKLDQYLEDNDLHNVKVRINQYAPGAEWRRLFHNKAIGPGWRYTVGVLTVATYTAFPQRLFGGDNYNPFTNTVNIYSDHKAIALHEGAHSKDAAGRKYKGTYAFLRILPVVPLVQEGIATSDAISYDMEKGLTENEKSDYKILYPAFGTYIAGEARQSGPLGYAITAGCAIPGHIIGRIKAAQVKDHTAGDRGETPKSSLESGASGN